MPHKQITSYIGEGAATLIHRALTPSVDPGGQSLGDDAIADRALNFFLEYYREHKLDQTRPYPGVLEALHLIRVRRPSLPMAVLTNKPVRPSREICSALNFAPFFFEVYGGDSYPKKPDPAGLQALIKRASSLRSGERQNALSPDTVVMIGDSHVDVETARRCGARSLGCTYGLSPDSLRAAQPDMLAASPEEWVSALGV